MTRRPSSPGTGGFHAMGAAPWPTSYRPDEIAYRQHHADDDAGAAAVTAALAALRAHLNGRDHPCPDPSPHSEHDYPLQWPPGRDHPVRRLHCPGREVVTLAAEIRRPRRRPRRAQSSPVVVEQPAPDATPQPQESAASAARRCRGCGYTKDRCACPPKNARRKRR